MYDLKDNLIRSAIVLLSILFIGLILLMTLVAHSIIVAILLPLLFTLLTVTGLILTFVPFFKDKLWLIPIVDIAVGAIVAVIVHFV